MATPVSNTPEIQKELSKEVISTETNKFEIKDPDTLIIKGKFKFKNASMYGIFAVLLSKGSGDSNDTTVAINNYCISTHIIASYFSDLFFTDITESWIVLEETFNALEIKGEYAVSITDNFKKGLAKAFSNETDKVSAMLKDFSEKKFGNLEKEMENILTQSYKNVAIQMEIQYEELSSADILSIKGNRILDESPQANSDVLETPFIRIHHQDFSIPAHPVLAPTGEGIPANQLSNGIRILMKVDGNTDYGKQWIKTFNLSNTEKSTINYLVGTVDQIGPSIKNSIDVLVKYRSDQYTKFNIESGIKLKFYNPNFPEGIVDPLVDFNDRYQASKVKNYSQLFNDPSLRLLVSLGVILTVLSFMALYFI